MQFLKDRVDSGGLLERLRIGVVVDDKLINALHELLDARERAAANGFVGDQREKTFNLIEPRAVSRDHVQRSPAMP